MMLTVKLTETRLTNPQVMGSSPIANRACWNYLSPILSNLTTPSELRCSAHVDVTCPRPVLLDDIYCAAHNIQPYG